MPTCLKVSQDKIVLCCLVDYVPEETEYAL